MTDAIERIASWFHQATPAPHVMGADLLTYAEFDTIIKARKKRFALSEYEGRSDDVFVIWCVPFAFFLEHGAEDRSINGGLTKPPRLYTAYYNEEFDATHLGAVKWCVAKALKPEPLSMIAVVLKRFRSERDRVGAMMATQQNANPPWNIDWVVASKAAVEAIRAGRA